MKKQHLVKMVGPGGVIRWLSKSASMSRTASAAGFRPVANTQVEVPDLTPAVPAAPAAPAADETAEDFDQNND